MSLKDQIKQAKTPAEVQTLLEQGLTTYTSASWYTREKWRRTAEQRIDDLLTPEPSAASKKERKAYRKAIKTQARQNLPQPA